MKIVQTGSFGEEKLGALTDGDKIVDLSDLFDAQDRHFLEPSSLATISAAVGERRQSARQFDPKLERIGAPIPIPQKIVCIGLNYADHAAESNMPVPEEPIVFFKAPNTLVGPFDDVCIPRGSIKTDWEVELGVVIGTRCRYLSSPEEAVASIAGFVVSNDVSEREFQLERGGQWVKGKSSESFNPCGPWLVTPDEITDVGDLDLWLDLNGKDQQRGNTRTLIFDVGTVVHYLSQFMVLEPGDLINTGTPPGVGLGMKPPTYLKAGDVMELGIAGLGTQRQRAVPAQ